MLNFNQYIEEKRGLWDNIHAKRKRIKAGSGEHMRKPGSKGAPSETDLKAANEENTQGDEGTPKLTKHRKKLTPGELPVTPEPLKNFETYK